jgi:hypothetical protein
VLPCKCFDCPALLFCFISIESFAVISTEADEMDSFTHDNNNILNVRRECGAVAVIWITDICGHKHRNTNEYPLRSQCMVNFLQILLTM